MSIKATYQKFEGWLQGKPDKIITIALIVTALFGIGVALLSKSKTAKAGLLAYWWFP